MCLCIFNFEEVSALKSPELLQESQCFQHCTELPDALQNEVPGVWSWKSHWNSHTGKAHWSRLPYSHWLQCGSWNPGIARLFLPLNYWSCFFKVFSHSATHVQKLFICLCASGSLFSWMTYFCKNQMLVTAGRFYLPLLGWHHCSESAHGRWQCNPG